MSVKDTTDVRVETPSGASQRVLIALREGAADLREGVADLREGAADLREGAADARQGTADLRDGAANLRECVADVREEAADVREEAADVREGAADLREGAADLREGAADVREGVADLREEAATVREEAATVRERALRPQEQARAIAEQSAVTQSQLREANENLVIATVNAQTRAGHDFLTGLPNRSLLADRLAQATMLAQRHGKKVALLVLDLDHFKQINDSLGHAVGDEVLKSTARRLEACLRRSDTISRYGGDEFVVVLSEVEAPPGDAAAFAEKLIEALAPPHLVAGRSVKVGVSIGISLFPDDGEDLETVFRHADLAMYHAKRDGRSSYRVFDAAVHGQANPASAPDAQRGSGHPSS